MFLLLMVVAIVAYAVNVVFIGGLVRRHDLGTVVTWRNLSLILTMSPLLVLAGPGEIPRLADAAGPLALACLLAGGANVLNAMVMRRLPIGIANALTQGLMTVALLLLAFLVFGERPGWVAYAWIAAVLGAVTLLGLVSRRGTAVVTRADILVGLAAAFGFAGCMGGALTALKQVARISGPYAAGWAWESGIGVVCLVGLLARRAVKPGAPLAARPRVLGRIALASSPTLVGTGCYAVASLRGDLGVAGALLACIMVAAAVCSRICFGEKLSTLQWFAIICACLAALGLGLS